MLCVQRIILPGGQCTKEIRERIDNGDLPPHLISEEAQPIMLLREAADGPEDAFADDDTRHDFADDSQHAFADDASGAAANERTRDEKPPEVRTSPRLSKYSAKAATQPELTTQPAKTTQQTTQPPSKTTEPAKGYGLPRMPGKSDVLPHKRARHTAESVGAVAGSDHQSFAIFSEVVDKSELPPTKPPKSSSKPSAKPSASTKTRKGKLRKGASVEPVGTNASSSEEDSIDGDGHPIRRARRGAQAAKRILADSSDEEGAHLQPSGRGAPAAARQGAPAAAPAAAAAAAQQQPGKKHKGKWRLMPAGYRPSVGEPVKAKYYADPKQAPFGLSSYRNHFYPGKVESIGDGVCTIGYDDQATEEDVLFSSLKVCL